MACSTSFQSVRFGFAFFGAAAMRKRMVDSNRNDRKGRMFGSPFAGGSPRVLFADCDSKEKRSNETGCHGRQKRSRRAAFPEHAADECRGCDGEAANEVVEADDASSDGGFSEVDDERLPRRLADLAQSSDDECQDQRRETVR